MKIKYYITLTFVPLALLFTGCDTNTQHHTTQVQKKEAAYVDFQRWSEGRVCNKVLWKCLPESNDTKRWQKPLENGLDSFELTPEINQKYDFTIKHYRKVYEDFWKTHDYKSYWNTHDMLPVLESKADQIFLNKVRAKHFLIELEESLQKEFPGFWNNVPKKVRYRWIYHAMNKAKFFKDRPKLNSYLMVELFARIGLDCDKDPKWEEITKFIASFSKTKDYKEMYGLKFTYWLLGNCCPYVGHPKRLFIPKSVKLEKEMYRWVTFEQKNKETP